MWLSITKLQLICSICQVTALEQAYPVPVDFFIDKKTQVLVITGPNTGGKTICLKTVGLTALMAKSGSITISFFFQWSLIPVKFTIKTYDDADFWFHDVNHFLNIAGLHVFSSESVQIPWFDSVFADIGDEQSLSQSLSTFSGHLKQISVRQIFFSQISAYSRKCICYDKHDQLEHYKFLTNFPWESIYKTIILYI